MSWETDTLFFCFRQPKDVALDQCSPASPLILSWPPCIMCSADSDETCGIRGRIAFAALVDCVPDLRPWGDIAKFRAPAWDDVRTCSYT